ncbi:MAG: hypothetical protein DRI61_11000 [Chloroflexi bacterium]|nr:MAG: hypothetical protein DRI61_11000 [Chloroflexota bacterium]
MVEGKFRVELPRERLEELKASRKLLEDLEEEIRRAEEAGIDVSELRARYAETRERVEKLLKVYAEE